MANFGEQQLGTAAILLFAFVPLGLCQINCDIGGCSSLFQSTFSDLLSNGLESLCRDIRDVLKCVNDCHKVFFPHFITTNSTIYFLNEVCNGDFIYDITVHWDCIRQHFNRLLTCIATSSSLESQHSKQNAKLLSCKKALAILDCPEVILYNQCEDKVVEAVSEAFQLGLKPLLTASCLKISYEKTSNLNVHSRLDIVYNRLAVCMDNNGYLAESCFHEYLEKAAHSELNSCSDDGAETICNVPSSSIPCSPPSFVGDFYSSIFSYGKQVCNRSPSNLHRKKPHRNINTTDTNVMELQKNLQTPRFMKDTAQTMPHASTMEAVTPSTLEEFNTTTSSLSVDDIKQSFSTLNSQTSDTDYFESEDFMYSSSSTIVPENMHGDTVLSDAPQNLSNTQIEGINSTQNVNNDIAISKNYHTSCGVVFVSFAYIFSSMVAILF